MIEQTKRLKNFDLHYLLSICNTLIYVFINYINIILTRQVDGPAAGVGGQGRPLVKSRI